MHYSLDVQIKTHITPCARHEEVWEVWDAAGQKKTICSRRRVWITLFHHCNSIVTQSEVHKMHVSCHRQTADMLTEQRGQGWMQWELLLYCLHGLFRQTASALCLLERHAGNCKTWIHARTNTKSPSITVAERSDHETWSETSIMHTLAVH